MQRIIAEMYRQSLEGVVVDGVPVDEFSGTFDLDREFTLRCDDGSQYTVSGWAVDVKVLES